MTQVTTPPSAPSMLLPNHHANADVSSGPTILSDLYTLTKPRIAIMVALTVWLGYAAAPMTLIAGTSGQSLAWLAPLGAMFGAALAAMGAAALNQTYERHTDRLMRRTCDRPLPSGRMSTRHAAAIGVTLGIVGCEIVYLFANPLAAAITLFTLVSYAGVYTPLKRHTTLNTLIGAVPGALPPIIGAAAAYPQAAWSLPAVLMFAIMFLWQLPHFLAIAWMHREDYARAGMAMLPVNDPTGEATFRQIILTSLALLPLGMLPAALGVAGGVSFIGSLIAGIVFLAFGLRLARTGDRVDARRVFLVSLIYLPVVLSLMVFDRV